MTKKFLAVTLVLVLAAGFAAVAQDDERPLMGTWENTLTLYPQARVDDGSNDIDNQLALSSDIDVTYMTGGITYTGAAAMDMDGLDDFEVGMETTVGLLDLSSTVNFNTQTPGLDYWTNQANLTLGGVSITDTFVLQDTADGVDEGFGAGMDLMFSGETPGGVSVSVNNYFGMEPVDYVGYEGLVTESSVGYLSTPWNSGYRIVTQGTPNDYGTSSLQYVGTMLTLENLTLGCCDFSSETMFSEMNGFEYSLFEFTIESNTWPLTLEGDLKFQEQTKSISLTPSLDTDWACFSVYTDLNGLLGNDGEDVKGSTINSFEVAGFAIKDVELGHVKFSSFTALGDHDLDYLETWHDADVPYVYGETYDEVFRIEKMEKYPLDFTLDTYFEMTDSTNLFDLAQFNGSMSYELDNEFTVGTGVAVKPADGLQSFDLTFDYSF